MRVSLGYTTLELLIVIAILAILSFIAIQEILSYIQDARLKEGVNQFLSDLNQVKNKAIITGRPWGIRACGGQGKYKIFIDHDGDCKDEAPSCESTDTQKVCLNAFNKTCQSDADCPFSQQGSCISRSQYFQLPPGITFNASFYVVFDRLGYPYNYSCGNGEGNATLINAKGKYLKIILSRLGRIRVE